MRFLRNTFTGIGLLDAMVLPSTDLKTGETFPAYYTFNDKNHLPPTLLAPIEKPEPRYPTAIIYDMKAGSGNDDAINSNFFAQINNGTMSFLASERIVKDKLLATKKGKNMSPYDRRVFLYPYEMTSRLIDELNNLRLKPTGITNQFKVEQISRSVKKDRFSALAYGLYRVKYYEENARNKTSTSTLNKFNFFTHKTRKRGR